MKLFYGWKMVMAASGLQIIQAMMLHQAFGAYVAVLAVEQGWSKTALSGASAMLSVEAALLSRVQTALALMFLGEATANTIP